MPRGLFLPDTKIALENKTIKRKYRCPARFNGLTGINRALRKYNKL